MAVPPTNLPPYVNIERQPRWHVSALFSTALESMTLPSRLKVLDRKRETLDEIAGALNVNGNQNIAKIEMSIGQKSQPNGDHRQGRLDVRGEIRENRMPSRNGHEDRIEAEEDIQPLDMDFFPSDEVAQSQAWYRHRKRVHVFGQADAERSDEHVQEHEDDQDDFDGQERARRRAAGLPIIHKSVHLVFNSSTFLFATYSFRLFLVFRFPHQVFRLCPAYSMLSFPAENPSYC